ncbi:hypothetical protein PTI98_007040 [Pleurotus ostreatus]|nr:hypothetical protein PTI98_007040 [Pleurotus ostreatus]
MARVSTKHDVASNRDHPIARTKTSNHICGILLRLNEQEPGCPHRETPVQYLYTYHDHDMSDEPAQFIESVFRMAGLEEPRLKPGEDFLTYVSRPKDTVVLYRSPDVSRAGPRDTQESHEALPYALPPSPSRPAHGRPTPPVYSSLPSIPMYSQHGTRIPGLAHVATHSFTTL